MSDLKTTRDMTMADQKRYYRVPLTLAPQPEGGFTVTSPAIPELVTEGDTIEEALANAADALRLVREIYEDRGAPLPVEVIAPDQPVTLDVPVSAA